MPSDLSTVLCSFPLSTEMKPFSKLLSIVSCLDILVRWIRFKRRYYPMTADPPTVRGHYNEKDMPLEHNTNLPRHAAKGKSHCEL